MKGIHCGKCIRLKQKGLIKGCKTYRRNKLVVENLGLVGSIAKKFRTSGAPMPDIIQMGTEGLIIASEKYDSKIGAFSTYARWWIFSKIVRGIVPYKSVPTSTKVQEMLIPINRFIIHFKNKNNRYPTPNEITANVKIKNYSKKNMLAAIGHNTAIAIEITALPSHIQAQLNDALGQDMYVGIKEALAVLTRDEKTVVRQRCNGETFKTIGERLLLSSEHIRQIEQRALRRLGKN